jgi:hypothetical protein
MCCVSLILIILIKFFLFRSLIITIMSAICSFASHSTDSTSARNSNSFYKALVVTVTSQLSIISNMAETYLIEALNRLKQTDKLKTYLCYLKEEWIQSKEDLLTAVNDEYTWEHLKLPARLKLEIRKLLLVETEEPRKEIGERFKDNEENTKKKEPQMASHEGKHPSVSQADEAKMTSSSATKPFNFKRRERYDGSSLDGEFKDFVQSDSKSVNLVSNEYVPTEAKFEIKDRDYKIASEGKSSEIISSDHDNSNQGFVPEYYQLPETPVPGKDDNSQEQEQLQLIEEIEVNENEEEVNDNSWELYYSEEYQCYYYYNKFTGESQWATTDENNTNQNNESENYEYNDYNDYNYDYSESNQCREDDQYNYSYQNVEEADSKEYHQNNDNNDKIFHRRQTPWKRSIPSSTDKPFLKPKYPSSRPRNGSFLSQMTMGDDTTASNFETKNLIRKLYVNSSEEEKEANEKREKEEQKLRKKSKERVKAERKAKPAGESDFEEEDYKGIDSSSALSSNSVYNSEASEYFIISENNNKVEKYTMPKATKNKKMETEDSLFVKGVDYINLDERNYFVGASAPPPVLGSNQNPISTGFTETSKGVSDKKDRSAYRLSSERRARYKDETDRSSPISDSSLVVTAKAEVFHNDLKYLSLALGTPPTTGSSTHHSPDRFPLKMKAQPTPDLPFSATEMGSTMKKKKKKHKFPHLNVFRSKAKVKLEEDEIVTTDTLVNPNRAENIRALIDLGYAEKTAIFALEVVNDDLNEAILMLTEAMGDITSVKKESTETRTYANHLQQQNPRDFLNESVPFVSSRNKSSLQTNSLETKSMEGFYAVDENDDRLHYQNNPRASRTSAIAQAEEQNLKASSVQRPGMFRMFS